MGRKDKDEKITDEDRQWGADIRRYVKSVRDGDSDAAQENANQLRRDYGDDLER